MKFSKSIRRVMLVVIGVVGASSLVACHGGGRGGQHHMGMVFDVVAYKLDFTDQQQEIMDRMQTQVKIFRQQRRDQRAEKRDEFIALIQADTLDTDRLKSMMDEHHQSVSELSPALMALAAELHATLTLEQKEKMTTYVALRGKRHQ